MHCKGKVVRMASNTRVGEMQLRSKKAVYRVSDESYALLSTKYERALNIPTQTIGFPNLAQNIGQNLFEWKVEVSCQTLNLVTISVG